MENISGKKIADLLNITERTWINWKKTKPKLVELVLKGLEIENGGITINGNNNIGAVIGNHNKVMINGNDVCIEICEALEKLPEQKQKKFYHKIMLEIYKELLNANTNKSTT
jgi:hypothetical protein